MVFDFENIKITDINIVSNLGKGGYGKVDLVQIKNYPNRSFALKTIRMKSLKQKEIKNILNEQCVLFSSTCPFIVHVYKTFFSSNQLYFLMESCLGGDMWHILDRYHSLKPNAAKFYIACVVEALDYLHSNRIVYRDLKPENLLLDNLGYLKMTDFGLCAILPHENLMASTFCGTLEYLAPEVIKKKNYDFSVDYWALGLLVHELLTGYSVFQNEKGSDIKKLIVKGVNNVKFPDYMSNSAQNLIKELCCVEPEHRLGYRNRNMNEVRNHKWFWDFDWDDLQNKRLPPPIMPTILNELDTRNFLSKNFPVTHNSFNYKNKLKKENEYIFEGFDYP